MFGFMRLIHICYNAQRIIDSTFITRYKKSINKLSQTINCSWVLKHNKYAMLFKENKYTVEPH